MNLKTMGRGRYFHATFQHAIFIDVYYKIVSITIIRSQYLIILKPTKKHKAYG